LRPVEFISDFQWQFDRFSSAIDLLPNMIFVLNSAAVYFHDPSAVINDPIHPSIKSDVNKLFILTYNLNKGIESQ